MTKPNGISLFNRSNHTAIAQLRKIVVRRFNCIRGCKVVADCNGTCRNAVFTVCLVLLSLTMSAQTRIVRTNDGNYEQQKIEFTTEQSVVDHYKLQPTEYFYKDVKGVQYRVYVKEVKAYFIKPNKDGIFRRHLLKID